MRCAAGNSLPFRTSNRGRKLTIPFAMNASAAEGLAEVEIFTTLPLLRMDAHDDGNRHGQVCWRAALRLNPLR